MKTLSLVFLSITGLVGFRCWSDDGSDLALGHRDQVQWADGAAEAGRKYAPSREVDILHLLLDVTPDFKTRTMKGRAVLRFKALRKSLSELRLDAVALAIKRVQGSVPVQDYQTSENELTVTFAEELPLDRETTLEIEYEAEPKKGMYFRTPEMGYRVTDTQLWTQGEAIEARHWFPCFDHPNDKFTSEVICRVPAGMTVISNGKRMSEERIAGSDLVAVRWLQDKPHTSYLIALVAGHLAKIEDSYRDIPLGFYTPPSQIEQATNSFRDIKDMLAFFEKETGVSYPWAKYDQACVEDFVAGGMENTSLTIMTDRTLFRAETENLRTSQGLVAHELAHQWFGDLVTCKDWSHLWLNEGFATFYQLLYDEHKDGRAEFLYGLYQNARTITGQANDTNAIVRRDFRTPDDQFSYLAYPKGGWVLHMLRRQLGPDLYRRCIKTYLERHQLGNVVTEDLQRVIEELTGGSYDQFFDQWVYHAHHPELDVTYSWDEKAKLARVSVRQSQKLSSAVLLFQFPLTIRFRFKDDVVDRTVEISAAEQEFYFPLKAAPVTVRIDPEYALLAKTAFHPSASQLRSILSDTNDVIGRLLAVEELGAKKDRESVDELGKVLQADAFYGVRMAAAKALRAVHTSPALEILRAAVAQTDARVRRQVVDDIGGFYDASAQTTLQEQIEREKNPDIIAAALIALGKYHDPALKSLFLRFLRSESYRNVLGDAAIAAMRAQQDPDYVAPLLELLRTEPSRFQTRSYASALGTLAGLARATDKKGTVGDFLLGRLTDARRDVQVGAINALGALEDERAIAALETFTSNSGESPQKTAAGRALNQLRDARKPGPELGQLRKEVLDLQKENRDLRHDFDQLKKKLESKDTSKARPATEN